MERSGLRETQTAPKGTKILGENPALRTELCIERSLPPVLKWSMFLPRMAKESLFQSCQRYQATSSPRHPFLQLCHHGVRQVEHWALLAINCKKSSLCVPELPQGSGAEFALRRLREKVSLSLLFAPSSLDTLTTSSKKWRFSSNPLPVFDNCEGSLLREEHVQVLLHELEHLHF